MNIKITDVTAKRVNHSNIFLCANSMDIESIDMIMDISYYIDEDSIDFEEFDITYETLDRYDLEDIIPCYMIVTLNNEDYKSISDLDYENLEYSVVSDFCYEVGEADIELYDKDKIDVLNLIEEYLKTDKFEKELKRALEQQSAKLNAM